MSVFVGAGVAMDYPAYLVRFTVTGAGDFSNGSAVGFFVAGANAGNGSVPVDTGALGVATDSGLIDAISTYLSGSGWDGGTVGDLTVTKYTETSSDATP